MLLLGGLHYAFSPSDVQPFPRVLADEFVKVALNATEIGPVPAIPLLRDSRVAPDQLDGFFGGDRQAKLLSLLPRQNLDFVQALVEETSLQGTVTGLEEHNQSAAWWSRLYIVLGASLCHRISLSACSEYGNIRCLQYSLQALREIRWQSEAPKNYIQTAPPRSALIVFLQSSDRALKRGLLTRACTKSRFC